MGSSEGAEFVEEKDESTFSPLDEMVKELDGPDLDGDLKEGEVGDEVKDDKSAEGSESEKVADEEAASGDEDEGKAAEEDEEGSGEKAEGAEDKKEETPDPKDVEIANLRATTRELTQEVRELRKKQASLDKKVEESGLAPAEEEERSVEADAVDEAIKIKLETLAETMKLSEKYADLDEVVTEERYNDIIEGAVAKLVEDGYDKDEAYDLANNYVWTKPNPYKYLYGLIKDGHPDYKKVDAGKDKDEEKEDKVEDKAEDKAPDKKEVAPTIHKTPGGQGGGKGGWTTAKIDDLPEDRLNEVPADVYDKYMKGELA